MSWDELVAAALIGTDRRAVEPQAPPGAPGDLQAALDQGRADDGLLAAAAAWTVARRAGAVPVEGRAVEPAPQDPRPLCSPAAAARLRSLLEDEELVEEWLTAAVERGVRPPPELVPALLDWAAGDPGAEALVVEAAGPLGPWLAGRAARWRFVPGAEDPAEVWARGEPAARRTLLRRLRAADPQAARELLESTFGDESPEDRAAFLEALETGLSDDDEPLLEAALDDRRQTVRAAAAELLAQLPESRFAQRMAGRARPLLALQDERITVALPEEPDAAGRRDGLRRTARRADLLQQILSLAPLATWTERFRRTAEDILRLDIADDYRDLVRRAFRDAAARQRDPAWAQALGILEVLPKRRRESLAARAADPAAAAADFPPPLGLALSQAIVAWFARVITQGGLYRISPHFGHVLDPAVLEALEALRDAGGRPVERLCDILATRAAMLRELS